MFTDNISPEVYPSWVLIVWPKALIKYEKDGKNIMFANLGKTLGTVL